MFKNMKGKKNGRSRKGSGGSSTSGGDDTNTSHHSSASSLVSLASAAASASASASADEATPPPAAAVSDTSPASPSLQNGSSGSRRRRNVTLLSSQQQQQQPQPSIHSLVPLYLKPVLTHYHGDFFATAQTDTILFTQVMAEGMLPIAAKTNDDDVSGMTIVLPKMHRQRCVIRLTPSPSDLHLSKSTKKKAKRYEVTLNQDFDEVVRGCHEQHGQNWLYEEVVQAFRSIHAQTTVQTQGQSGRGGQGQGVPAMLFDPPDTARRPTGSVPVRLYSVEVYNVESGKLVAGELGYTVGSIYTSLTGFSSEDGAGSVQLAVLGRRLEQCGFDLWDMGMGMDYKERLGAHGMQRADFIRLVRRVRVERPNVLLTLEQPRMSCKEILYGPSPTPMDVDEKKAASNDGTTSSKKAKKAQKNKQKQKKSQRPSREQNHCGNGKKHSSEEAEEDDQKPRKRQEN